MRPWRGFTHFHGERAGCGGDPDSTRREVQAPGLVKTPSRGGWRAGPAPCTSHPGEGQSPGLTEKCALRF